MKKLFFILLMLPLALVSQSVSGTFSPAKDFSYAFLYKSTPQGASYINRAKLDSLGNFEIPIDSTATAGIYKIVYAVPPEENNFDIIYDGKSAITFNFSNEKGVEFTASEDNKLWTSYLNSMAMVNQTISNYFNKEADNKEGFNSVFKVLKDSQLAYEEAAKGKLVATFILANRPYIPSAYEDVSTYSKNLKDNYLANINFNDYLLQISSFLVNRVTNYVFNLVENPTNDTYKTLVDETAKTLNTADTDIQVTLIKILWQRFVASENSEMANYITDNHLLKLTRATDNNDLANTIIGYKNTSIGIKAPNFDIGLTAKFGSETTTLHQLKGSKHYLLIFWSSTCGHCLNELPKVKALVAEKTNLKVIAYGLEDDNIKWDEEIKNYPDFIHTIGIGKWDHPITKSYGVTATPMYYLLSESKIIMAKPYSFKDLEVLLKNL